MTEKLTISAGVVNNPYEQASPAAEEQAIEIKQAPVEEVTKIVFANNQPETREPEVQQEKAPLGYMTREEYIKRKGTDEGYKSPEDFQKALETNPWMKKERFEKMEQELNSYKSEMSQVKSLMTKQFEAGKKAALDELNQKSFQAIQEGNQAEWQRLEEEKGRVQQQQPPINEQPAYTQQAQAPVPPELMEWKNKNPWFGQDMEMTNEAVRMSEELMAQSPWAAPAIIASEIERQIKSKYASKFGLPNGQQQTSYVNRGNSAVQQNQKTYSVSELSAEDRQLASKWRKYGYKSQDEYVKDILKTY